jgi:four helix bundle protein
VKDYRKLEVWRRSHALALEVYRLTRPFPKEELFGLTSQLRRASVSVAANLAEGCGRDSDAELRRFLEIAHGSASEVEYHLLLARDLNLLSADAYQGVADEISQIKRMLGSLARKLKADR